MPEPGVPAVTSVLVSGGSRGLGLAIVTDLLSAGVKVATFSRSVTDELERLARDHAEQLVIGSVDLTDDEQTRRFVETASSQLGPFDGLVNNAAIGQDALFVQTAVPAIEQLIEVDLTAPLRLTRLFLRQMLRRSGRGRIVTVSSLCAQRGYSGLAVYAAAKGGLEAATRSLARELRGRALINAVAPGFFPSEMSAVLGTEALDSISRRTPSGRLVEPADLLPIVRLLLLEETNINGQVLAVDGGASI